MIKLEVYGDLYTTRDVELFARYSSFINKKFNTDGNIFKNIKDEYFDVLTDFDEATFTEKRKIQQFMVVNTYEKSYPKTNIIVAIICALSTVFIKSFIINYFIIMIAGAVVLYSMFLYTGNKNCKTLLKMIDNFIK